MESLGKSVYDILKLNDYQPFPLKTVKIIGKQVLINNLYRCQNH